jgi:5-deoxy-D-glucuronate isomerase
MRCTDSRSPNPVDITRRDRPAQWSVVEGPGLPTSVTLVGLSPHKHDTERPPTETAFQEVYHYRFRPESGFGCQVCYEEGAEPTAVVTRHG